MEEKSFPNFSKLKLIFFSPLTYVAIFACCYVAVLPMANTIALRNVALFLLLFSMGIYAKKIYPHLSFDFSIKLWAIYLLIFPVIAADHITALDNLEGQWGRSLLALLVGSGSAILFFGRVCNLVLLLAAVSAVPLFIHLGIVFRIFLESGAIPWGNWGRESHHADLGYAAGQVAILASASFNFGGNKLRRCAIFLIACAMLSTFVAQSRAGLIFTIFGAVFVFFIGYICQPQKSRFLVFPGFLAMMLAGAALVPMSLHLDSRWASVGANILVGFMGNPIQIECEGTDSIVSKIAEKYGANDVTEELVNSVRIGDASRLVLLRAGLELVSENPWGADGSRQSFQKLLREKCATPTIVMAHVHNGWVDTLLAIGWLGGVLYLLVLIRYARLGFSLVAQRNEWALVLIGLSIFWILRGFTDSVFRDHMLEMQGFTLAFAATALGRSLTAGSVRHIDSQSRLKL